MQDMVDDPRNDIENGPFESINSQDSMQGSNHAENKSESGLSSASDMFDAFASNVNGSAQNPIGANSLQEAEISETTSTEPNLSTYDAFSELDEIKTLPYSAPSKDIEFLNDEENEIQNQNTAHDQDQTLNLELNLLSNPKLDDTKIRDKNCLISDMTNKDKEEELAHYGDPTMGNIGSNIDCCHTDEIKEDIHDQYVDNQIENEDQTEINNITDEASIKQGSHENEKEVDPFAQRNNCSSHEQNPEMEKQSESFTDVQDEKNINVFHQEPSKKTNALNEVSNEFSDVSMHDEETDSGSIENVNIINEIQNDPRITIANANGVSTSVIAKEDGILPATVSDSEGLDDFQSDSHAKTSSPQLAPSEKKAAENLVDLSLTHDVSVHRSDQNGKNKYQLEDLEDQNARVDTFHKQASNEACENTLTAFDQFNTDHDHEKDDEIINAGYVGSTSPEEVLKLTESNGSIPKCVHPEENSIRSEFVKDEIQQQHLDPESSIAHNNESNLGDSQQCFESENKGEFDEVENPRAIQVAANISDEKKDDDDFEDCCIPLKDNEATNTQIVLETKDNEYGRITVRDNSGTAKIDAKLSTNKDFEEINNDEHTTMNPCNDENGNKFKCCEDIKEDRVISETNHSQKSTESTKTANENSILRTENKKENENGKLVIDETTILDAQRKGDFGAFTDLNAPRAITPIELSITNANGEFEVLEGPTEEERTDKSTPTEDKQKADMENCDIDYVGCFADSNKAIPQTENVESNENNLFDAFEDAAEGERIDKALPNKNKKEVDKDKDGFGDFGDFTRSNTKKSICQTETSKLEAFECDVKEEKNNKIGNPTIEDKPEADLRDGFEPFRNHTTSNEQEHTLYDEGSNIFPFDDFTEGREKATETFHDDKQEANVDDKGVGIFGHLSDSTIQGASDQTGDTENIENNGKGKLESFGGATEEEIRDNAIPTENKQEDDEDDGVDGFGDFGDFSDSTNAHDASGTVNDKSKESSELAAFEGPNEKEASDKAICIENEEEANVEDEGFGDFGNFSDSTIQGASDQTGDTENIENNGKGKLESFGGATEEEIRDNAIPTENKQEDDEDDGVDGFGDFGDFSDSTNAHDASGTVNDKSKESSELAAFEGPNEKEASDKAICIENEEEANVEDEGFGDFGNFSDSTIQGASDQTGDTENIENNGKGKLESFGGATEEEISDNAIPTENKQEDDEDDGVDGFGDFGDFSDSTNAQDASGTVNDKSKESSELAAFEGPNEKDSSDKAICIENEEEANVEDEGFGDFGDFASSNVKELSSFMKAKIRPIEVARSSYSPFVKNAEVILQQSFFGIKTSNEELKTEMESPEYNTYPVQRLLVRQPFF